MSVKHTPGPWRIVIDGTCSAAWPFIVPADVSDDDIFEETIAELSSTHVQKSRRGVPGSYAEKPQRFKPTDDHDTIMANARLIAAAPKLLESLRWYVDGAANGRSYEEWIEGRERAVAAIAAATGESA